MGARRFLKGTEALRGYEEAWQCSAERSKLSGTEFHFSVSQIDREVQGLK